MKSRDTFSDFDRSAMQRALALAARGLTSTDPNPRVGCVIARGDRIVGEGWHERPGEAHAECRLRAAAPRPRAPPSRRDLEPCSHHGRTAPCTLALTGARVARVVSAIGDPNPQVNGQGAAALTAAGITVQSGLLESEAHELNAGFFKRMQHGRPFVRVKLAMSLDGRTALADGTSQWITGEAARADVQAWRARSSAVLTGVGTVLSDDPSLRVRLPADAEPRQPLRVVLDTHLRTPEGARLFTGGGEVLILTALAGLDEARAAALSARVARVETLPSQGEHLDLGAVFDRLGELDANEVLVEAGATLAGAILRQGLADELLLYVAPKLLGPTAAPGRATPLANLTDAPGFSFLDSQRIGEDLRLRLRPVTP